MWWCLSWPNGLERKRAPVCPQQGRQRRLWVWERCSLWEAPARRLLQQQAGKSSGAAVPTAEIRLRLRVRMPRSVEVLSIMRKENIPASAVGPRTMLPARIPVSAGAVTGLLLDCTPASVVASKIRPQENFPVYPVVIKMRLPGNSPPSVAVRPIKPPVTGPPLWAALTM